MIQSLLKLLPPELAHAIAKWAMKRRLRAPGRCESSPASPSLFGAALDNPLGLAAGFDKNGELVEQSREYGFGFIEIGSVTFRGGAGNPKPRLFRLPNGHLLNRLGLNGDPAEVVAARLRKFDRVTTLNTNFGVNIAKTHDPEIVGDKAIQDIVGSYVLLRDFGLYTVLNISCPNTREGKTFEDPGALKDLLSALTPHRMPRTATTIHTKTDGASFLGTEYSNFAAKPLLLKISPALADAPTNLVKINDIAEEFQLAGFVVSNTLPITGALFDDEQYRRVFNECGKGGLSGPAMTDRALTLIKLLRALKCKKTIIGCGGIQAPYDMLSFKCAGADFFQAYSGFVVGKHAGPRFAHFMNEGYARPKDPNVVEDIL